MKKLFLLLCVTTIIIAMEEEEKTTKKKPHVVDMLFNCARKFPENGVDKNDIAVNVKAVQHIISQVEQTLSKYTEGNKRVARFNKDLGLVSAAFSQEEVQNHYVEGPTSLRMDLEHLDIKLRNEFAVLYKERVLSEQDRHTMLQHLGAAAVFVMRLKHCECFGCYCTDFERAFESEKHKALSGNVSYNICKPLSLDLIKQVVTQNEKVNRFISTQCVLDLKQLEGAKPVTSALQKVQETNSDITAILKDAYCKVREDMGDTVAAFDFKTCDCTEQVCDCDDQYSLENIFMDEHAKDKLADCDTSDCIENMVHFVSVCMYIMLDYKKRGVLSESIANRLLENIGISNMLLEQSRYYECTVNTVQKMRLQSEKSKDAKESLDGLRECFIQETS